MIPSRWVSDTTGRFAKRPHYSPEQLDAECERVVNSFLMARHGRAVFPISTDDLTVMLERAVDDFDPYADFSAESGDIEGLTEFRRGARPAVKISGKLTNTSSLENRLRTTLTHEYGHVHFHDHLYQVDSKPASLFDDPQVATSPPPQAHRCKRDSMVSFSERDWMEWQAGYVCGAMLMPMTQLLECVQQFRKHRKLEHAAISEQSKPGDDLVHLVANAFQTSRDAARVRLLQQKFLSSGHALSLL